MISFGYDTSPKAITCRPTRLVRVDGTFSSIRTLTVGPGISPGLLDPLTREALAGLHHADAYRRWGVSPRPENTLTFYDCISLCKLDQNGSSVPHRRHSIPKNAARCTSDRFKEAAPRHRGRRDRPVRAGARRRPGHERTGGTSCPEPRRCIACDQTVRLLLTRIRDGARRGNRRPERQPVTLSYPVSSAP